MVNFYTNSLTKSGAQEESTYGTAAVSFSWFGLTQSFNVNQSNETIKNRTQNLSRETFSVDVLKQMFNGTVSWRVQDATFLLAAFGTLNTSGAGPYTHTFTTGDSLISYTLYNETKGRGGASDIVDTYQGCKTNEFKLSVSEGEYLMAENNIMSNGKTSSVTPVAITASTEKGFKYADIVNGEITVDSTALKVNSYEYTRNNTLSEEQSGLTISEPCAQELDENLTLNMKLSGAQIATLINTGAEVPVVLLLTRGTHTFQVTHQVVFKEAPGERGTEGVIDVSVTADVRSTTIVVVNDTVTYTF